MEDKLERCSGLLRDLWRDFEAGDDAAAKHSREAVLAALEEEFPPPKLEPAVALPEADAQGSPASRRLNPDFESIPELPTDIQARIAYIRGKALYVSDSPPPAADEALEDAVRSDPTQWDAWRCLADLKLLRRDFVGARDACLAGLRWGPKQARLHMQLSQVLRSSPPSSAARGAALAAQSVECAKKAVAFAPGSAEAHYNLGMAHLSLCFRSQVQVPALRQAVDAYETATRLQRGQEGAAAATGAGHGVGLSLGGGGAPESKGGEEAGGVLKEATGAPSDGPTDDAEAAGRMGVVRMREMHFNRGIALRFDGRYDMALAAFRLAQSDPMLPVKAEVATTKRRVVQISTALKRAARQRALQTAELEGRVKEFIGAVEAARARARANALGEAGKPSTTVPGDEVGQLQGGSKTGSAKGGGGSAQGASSGRAGGKASGGGGGGGGPVATTVSPKVAKRTALAVGSRPFVGLSSLLPGRNSGVAVVVQPFACQTFAEQPPPVLVCCDASGEVGRFRSGRVSERAGAPLPSESGDKEGTRAGAGAGEASGGGSSATVGADLASPGILDPSVDSRDDREAFLEDPQMMKLEGCAAVAAYAVPTTAAPRLSAASVVVLIDPVLTVACLHKERPAGSSTGGAGVPGKGSLVVGFPLVRAESAEHLLVDGFPAGSGGATQDEAKIGNAW